MATFRKVHTSFWSDPYVQSLSPEQKYFYLYLLTNEKTKQCGIYEIARKQIAYDTGYNIDTVSILLKYFIDSGKIRVSEATNEIAIKNWNRYNGNTSPKVQKLVNQELTSVKEKSLILYLYSTDTVALHKEEEEEEEREIEEEKVNNKKGGSQFPKAENFNGLDDMKTGQVIEFLKATKGVVLDQEAVGSIWGVFKMKNLTGQKFYKDEHAVYSHFLDSLKYQQFNINKKNTTNATDQHVIGKTFKKD
jgi:hypothetical protein